MDTYILVVLVLVVGLTLFSIVSFCLYVFSSNTQFASKAIQSITANRMLVSDSNGHIVSSEVGINQDSHIQVDDVILADGSISVKNTIDEYDALLSYTTSDLNEGDVLVTTENKLVPSDVVTSTNQMYTDTVALRLRSPFSMVTDRETINETTSAKHVASFVPYQNMFATWVVHCDLESIDELENVSDPFLSVYIRQGETRTLVSTYIRSTISDLTSFDLIIFSTADDIIIYRNLYNTTPLLTLPYTSGEQYTLEIDGLFPLSSTLGVIDSSIFFTSKAL